MYNYKDIVSDYETYALIIKKDMYVYPKKIKIKNNRNSLELDEVHY